MVAWKDVTKLARFRARDSQLFMTLPIGDAHGGTAPGLIPFLVNMLDCAGIRQHLATAAPQASTSRHWLHDTSSCPVGVPLGDQTRERNGVCNTANNSVGPLHIPLLSRVGDEPCRGLGAHQLTRLPDVFSLT